MQVKWKVLGTLRQSPRQPRTAYLTSLRTRRWSTRTESVAALLTSRYSPRPTCLPVVWATEKPVNSIGVINDYRHIFRLWRYVNCLLTYLPSVKKCIFNVFNVFFNVFLLLKMLNSECENTLPYLQVGCTRHTSAEASIWAQCATPADLMVEEIS